MSFYQVLVDSLLALALEFTGVFEPFSSFISKWRLLTRINLRLQVREKKPRMAFFFKLYEKSKTCSFSMEAATGVLDECILRTATNVKMYFQCLLFIVVNVGTNMVNTIIIILQLIKLFIFLLKSLRYI